MAIEIEAKIKVNSHDGVRARLVTAGAERVGCVLESNHIFDRADGSLRATDSALRVRSYEPLEGPARPATLTFKGPRQAGDLKRRDEIELSVDDAAAAIALFESLGFEQRVAFQKRRESYRLMGCLVELDEVPLLGCFVEVEGPGEAHIHRVLEALALEHEPNIPASYVAMLVAYCEEHGRAMSSIRFE